MKLFNKTTTEIKQIVSTLHFMMSMVWLDNQDRMDGWDGKSRTRGGDLHFFFYVDV